MSSRECLRATVLLLLVLTPAVTLGQRPITPPPSTAEWLVDLARDHALMRRGKSTAADVQMVRTYLDAAVRLDPNQVHAWELLYELAVLENDNRAIGAAVNALLQADPSHERGFECWLQAGIRSAATLEARTRWLESVEGTNRPTWQRSMVQTALASAAIEQLDLGRASKLLQAALDLEPANLVAAQMVLETLDPAAPQADWLKAQLRILQLNPLSGQTAWQVASILDGEAFTNDAARFFDYALAMQQRVYPTTPIPGAFWLAMARNRTALGRPDEAIEFARKAIAADPQVAAEAGFLAFYLHARKGDGLANRVKADLLQRFSDISDPAASPSNEVAQAAWFNLVLDPVPDRALALARSAYGRVPGDRFARRVFGWALAANQLLDEARSTLEPLAKSDAWAAYRLAAIALSTGDVEAARTIASQVEVRPQNGPIADALAALARSLDDPSIPLPTSWPISAASTPTTSPAETQPSASASTRPFEPPTAQPPLRPSGARADLLAAALSTFDERVLEYYRDVTRFVEFKATPASRALAVGEPWIVEFTLTNRGPFVVTLGPNAMLNPVVVLSLTMDGDQKRNFPGYATVSLDRQRLLRPGETIRLRRAIDVGPPRRASRDTPQQTQRVTLSAIVDAVLGSDGSWKAGPSGQVLTPPAYLNRQPLATDRATFSALLGAADGPTAQRLRAIEVIVGLIGERQRADLKRLSYTPTQVPIDPLRASLFRALGSDDAELRARALEALRGAGLDRSLVEAIEPSLTHKDWLVRLMAAPLVARQGGSVRAAIERTATQDDDPLVRAMAAAVLAEWEQAGGAGG